MTQSTSLASKAPETNRRYHSLDQLRAVMMMLGMVIHSAVSFISVPRPTAWPYNDTNTSVLFDILVFFIHVFRMPLFFLVAGFFTAYLYYRSNPWQMLSNRMARVGLPFALFLPILFPLGVSGSKFSIGGGVNGGWDVALTYLSTPAVWYEKFRTMHLWFLYYLILFYAIIAIFMPLIEKATGSWAVTVGPRLGRFIHHPLGLLVAISTTFLTLLPMRGAGLDTETNFLVEPKILVAYGVFVGFGWVLYLNRDRLDDFGARAWTYIGTGFLLSCAYLAVALSQQNLMAGKALAAGAMWILIYGFVGLFVRYYDHPNPLGRYLADASYWMYLVHIPVAMWVPGLMNGWGVHAMVKFSIVLSASVVFSLATYHLFVRSTAIGAFLNGKRYPRALPSLQEVAPQAAAQTA
jgi:glucans biosynthesis protein C